MASAVVSLHSPAQSEVAHCAQDDEEDTKHNKVQVELGFVHVQEGEERVGIFEANLPSVALQLFALEAVHSLQHGLEGISVRGSVMTFNDVLEGKNDLSLQRIIIDSACYYRPYL